MVDSRIDTYQHIQTVQRYVGAVVSDLQRRSQEHDQSKLASPEKEIFDEFTPKLASSTYGSDEYKTFLGQMKPALDHHYTNNDHHPEYHKVVRCSDCGESYPINYEPAVCLYCTAPIVRTFDIRLMNLVQLIEMLCDWKAATMRHNDGDIRRSIEINQKRFGYSDELKVILLNTLAVIEG